MRLTTKQGKESWCKSKLSSNQKMHPTGFSRTFMGRSKKSTLISPGLKKFSTWIWCKTPRLFTTASPSLNAKSWLWSSLIGLTLISGKSIKVFMRQIFSSIDWSSFVCFSCISSLTSAISLDWRTSRTTEDLIYTVSSGQDVSLH